MTSKIVVGPIEQGLRTNRLPFAIDNDTFPTLINAYQWRGRAKRKRGTSFICRLTRFFNSASTSYSSTATITLDGSGHGNIITGFSLESTSSIIPGTVTITAPGPTLYIDPNKDGTLSPSGSINYASGAIIIAAAAGQAVNASFDYYPALPAMGERIFDDSSTEFPREIGFDTKYSYNILTAFPYPAYDVSFYKNPPSGTYPGYVHKTTVTPTSWNGQDYQQFWTTNAQGVLWATNGINIPFSVTNVGMQFQKVTASSVVLASPTVVTFTLGANPLVIGDFVFTNEFTSSGTPSNATTLNFQTGYVTATGAGTVTVTFPNAAIADDTYSNGILQFLTNRSDITKDCLRWYDGDPTNGNILNPSLTGNEGWVNFAPALIQTGPTDFSISDEVPGVYYLVGARMIQPFKNRLLFLGPVIQTSSPNSQIYLPDTVIYSQDGTAFYTSSWQGATGPPFDPRLVNNSFLSILTPDNETGFPAAWFEDSTGFGGFTSADLNEPMLTCSSNEDSLIIGFTTNQTRLIFTGNDILPFEFYLINAELGSSSTFSAVNMDRGVITRGSRGYIITSQTNSERIDLQNPDQVFQTRLTNNGPERITAARDYLNEWIYFTYPSNENSASTYRFPTQTFQFNYRDNSWGIFNETYTSYGQFSRQTGFTWQTVGLIYSSWNAWNQPWNAGGSTLLQPEVIAGNQQGFILARADGTSEATSLFIQAINNSTVTSPDHCLNTGDYITISGCIGPIGYILNSRIFSVQNVTQNTFDLNPNIDPGTYIGGGLITRYYIPFIQTKQFPMAWGDGRKTRLGVQRYLLTKTTNSQIQLLIYLSQDSANPYNTGSIVPVIGSVNDSLIYSTTLFTCPESTNLGLTPSNVNLMTPTAMTQAQLWHRINTSLIGDTVQLGFTMSDAQMRDFLPGIAVSITGATQANPCVLTTTANFSANKLVMISGVVGMTELNGNTYIVISSTSTHMTIGVNSSGFDTYISGGSVTPLSPVNQESEIELHGFVIDVTPSQMLV